jgi:cardiolipin synthase (CMP-forming)
VGTPPVEPRRLSTRRLLGLDRSGPPPPETLAGRPLRPWTIPNAIGYARAALIPVFLVLAYGQGAHGGVSVGAGIAFFVAAMADYADGMAARVTGQYSRLGTLLDPIVDRALVIAGVAVCWSFQLLPRWALAVLLARELVMLVVGRLWLRRGLELRINWPGRIAVGPTMLGLFLGLVGVRALGEILLYLGIALALVATGQYYRAGTAQLRARRERAAPAGD